jgi:4-alpha-glucanotransferase
MSKFTLAFGIHNHQPVGNFDSVFEESHRNAYLPFLKLFQQFPGMSLSLHQSGILWNWQKKNHPDYFDLISTMINSGQIEVMTGGFFEPILTSIPERDALGQITMLTDYLEDRFKTQPKGLWLTERIWEPHLPKLLAQAGIRFLPVDDTHFVYAGLELNQLTGPFVTENEGKAVTLLPIQKRLRYLIPFGTVDEVIAELKSQANRQPDGLAVYADDGEKFGVWPKTHQHCFTDGWLQRFFDAVEKNKDWLQVKSLSYAASKTPVGRVYLPSASYAEMLHWSLPSAAFIQYEEFEQTLDKQGLLERYGRFVRGGHWRGFLAKYDESNLMHKKMLSVSDRLERLSLSHSRSADALAKARERLFAGQCNCPYWHGVFGGLYLPHIRQAVYENLVTADAILADVEQIGTTITARDYDADGRNEVVVSSDSLSAVFRPHSGGMLIDLSLNEEGFNLTDTLTRRREGYHAKLDKAVTSANSSSTASIHDLILAKEDGLKEALVEDWYLKRCFIDHFFTSDVDLRRFRSGKFGEEGDFVLEPYEYEIDAKQKAVVLSRRGRIYRPEGAVPLEVQKRFSFATPHIIDASWRLTTSEKSSIRVRFGVETNFTFQAGHEEDRFILIDGERQALPYLDSVAEHTMAHGFSMIDDYRRIGVALTGERPAEIWRMPIFTVSLSEGGFEKVYQGTTFVQVFELDLSPKPTHISLSLTAGSSKLISSVINKDTTASGRS